MQAPRKVLIIRFSSIGDIVLCSPVVRCIKSQWNSEIHFITKKQFAGVIKDSPFIDKVITIEKNVSEASNQLIAESYDLVVDLHKNIRSHQVRSKVNTSSTSFDKLNVQKWITVNTPFNILPQKHLVDRYFEGLASFDLQYDDKGLDHFISHSEIAKAKSIVSEPYAVISLGATYKTKRLPKHKLVQLLEEISTSIVFIGGPDVVELAYALEKSTEKPIVNTVGQISIGVSSALIANSTYVVSGDTGMMHIAAAHKKPLIVYWGSTHTSLGMYPFYPISSNVSYYPISLDLACQPCSKIGKDECPKGHFDCMLKISDEQLKNTIRNMEQDIGLHL